MSSRKKKRTLGLGGLAILLIAVGAIAYWTAGGDGTGSAEAGTTESLVVNQTTVLSAMYPGDSAQTISGTFANGNEGPIYVGNVTASIGSVTKAAGAPAGTCDATDFTLGSAAMTVNAEVPVGAGVGAWTGATLKFNNKATNQDACKDATVTLAYTIS